jgi:hypothetical protein
VKLTKSTQKKKKVPKIVKKPSESKKNCQEMTKVLTPNFKRKLYEKLPFPNVKLMGILLKILQFIRKNRCFQRL